MIPRGTESSQKEAEMTYVFQDTVGECGSPGKDIKVNKVKAGWKWLNCHENCSQNLLHSTRSGPGLPCNSPSLRASLRPPKGPGISWPVFFLLFPLLITFLPTFLLSWLSPFLLWSLLKCHAAFHGNGSQYTPVKLGSCTHYLLS